MLGCLHPARRCVGANSNAKGGSDRNRKGSSNDEITQPAIRDVAKQR